MRTIETTVNVDEQHRASIQFPADVPPGPHRVVLTIEEAPSTTFRVEDLPRHDFPWPFAPGETFRREDMYGDDGR